MSNAEYYLREQIAKFAAGETLPKPADKVELSKDVRYAFWHEFIDLETYGELNRQLERAYTLGQQNYFEAEAARIDAVWMAKLQAVSNL